MTELKTQHKQVLNKRFVADFFGLVGITGVVEFSDEWIEAGTDDGTEGTCLSGGVICIDFFGGNGGGGL